MKRYLSILVGVVALSAAPTLSAQAPAKPHTLTPPDAMWGVVFDPAKIRTSALAQHAMAHFDDGQREELNGRIDGFSNLLGLDLRRDLGHIVAFGYGLEPTDMALAVDIGQAQTNIEGLLLANEHYDSHEYGDLIVHSVQDNPDATRLFCAVMPGRGEQAGVMLLSPSRDRTERLVDQARTGARVADPKALLGDQFLRLWVDRIPDDFFAGQPRQSNIAGMIQSLEIVGTTGKTDSSVAVHVSLTNPARARQLYQMAAGGKALIELAAASDPDAEKLADLLAYVRVDQPPKGSNRLSITASCDTQGLAAVLDLLEEAGAFEELKLD